MKKPARSARTARARKPRTTKAPRKQRLPKVTAEMRRKLAALDEAMKYRFPAPAIEQMLWETEQGYVGRKR